MGIRNTNSQGTLPGVMSAAWGDGKSTHRDSGGGATSHLDDKPRNSNPKCVSLSQNVGH